MSDFWKSVGKKNVKLFDSEEEIRRKKEEEERKKRQMANPNRFGKLRNLFGDKTAAEVATEEAKKLRKKQLGY